MFKMQIKVDRENCELYIPPEKYLFIWLKASTRPIHVK